MECNKIKMKFHEETEVVHAKFNDIGNKGEQGLSAYEVALQHGFIGTEQEWLDSLRYDHSEEFTKLAEQVKNDSRLSQQALEEITTLVNGFDSKVTQANANLDTKVQGINTNLDTKVQGINNDLDSKITNANEVIDTKVNEATTQANNAKNEADRAKGYADTMQSVQAEVKQAHTGYFGKEYETLDERVDGDIHLLLGDNEPMNFQGTEINAEHTQANNLNVLGNKFEIKGKTKQNLASPQLITNYAGNQWDLDLNISLNKNYVISFKKNMSMLQLIEKSTSRVITTKYNTNKFVINTNVDSFFRFDSDAKFTSSEEVANTLQLQLEEGTIPTPYTPFGLYTDPQVTLVEHGKNLFDGQWELGTISSNGEDVNSLTNIRTSNYMELKLDTFYTIQRFGEIKNANFRFYDINKKYLTNMSGNRKVLGSNNPIGFTLPKNAQYIRITLDGIDDINYKMQIEQGSVATDYQPYQGTKVVFDTPLESLVDGSVANTIELVNKEWQLTKRVQKQGEEMVTLPSPIVSKIVPIEGNEVFSYEGETHFYTENLAKPTLNADLPIQTDIPVTRVTSSDGSIIVDKKGNDLDVKVANSIIDELNALRQEIDALKGNK